ncbi:MAG: sulfatase-like hydrolase/transferase [Kiritimatiellae bacterium]|nr:sulfatase-like hydrolase/transferase [Kiritimatiellia bacterium]
MSSERRWRNSAAGALVSLAAITAPGLAERPNIVMVITDDQGYGELSAHGNPILRTPHLDRLREQSIRLTDFHVAPMCTPTRGQLLTGLDAFRNGAMNVSSGRTRLRRGIPTLADHLRAAGYSTGLFGKWHLGDSVPCRPEDRGFETALWFPSSHIGSVPDAWANDYFDDVLVRDGRRVQVDGYTTEVTFREAIEWMRVAAGSGRPFFAYIATAAPHWPHFVPADRRDAVARALVAARPDLAAAPFREELERYLAMIECVDECIGRLDAFLHEHELAHRTILVFLTDNGSTFGPRYYNAGMRGGKTTLWEGGHRVPCFVRWPGGRLRPPGDVPGLTQAQDLVPTLLELCGVPPLGAGRFDGVSLAPVLRGEAAVPPEDRMLVINYSRMPTGANEPQVDARSLPRREGALVLWRSWRLIEDRELYDLRADPLQQTNVIRQHPEVVARMRAHLDKWWASLGPRAAEIEPVVVGDPRENPVWLTSCDWVDVFLDQQAQVRRGERKNGAWEIEIARSGLYRFELSRWPPESSLALTDGVPATNVTDGVFEGGEGWPVRRARLRVGEREVAVEVREEDRAARMELELPAGRTRMQTWFEDSAGRPIAGAFYVRAEWWRGATPRRIILDTDMSGDADDAAALAVLHALADLGECELLAVLVNRKDLANASAAAVDAINTWYGRGGLPIGTDKVGPTARQRRSPYAAALRDGFPNDIGPDDRAPDALDVYREVLAAQPDHSVTICSIGAFSNLAELWRREAELVRRKVEQLVVMGGEFPPGSDAETNIATHPEAARFVAAEWPTEIVWHGFEIGDRILTGSVLKRAPPTNPVRRAFELRHYKGRPSIESGQPSYDPAAVLYAVRGDQPQLWDVWRRGTVVVDERGQTHWHHSATGRHALVRLRAPPARVAEILEELLAAPPRRTRR